MARAGAARSPASSYIYVSVYDGTVQDEDNRKQGQSAEIGRDEKEEDAEDIGEESYIYESADKSEGKDEV